MPFKPHKDRYNKMKYHRCGQSGLLLPAVSLGLWHNFGNVDSFKTSRDMLCGAFDMGITHFDLANNYGPPPGSAEVNFGKVLKSDLKAYRDELILSTKAGYRMWEGPYGDGGSRKYLLASLDQSLKRMGVDYVDIFYSHRPDSETPLEETMGALASAVEQGKALYAGISSYSAEDTNHAHKLLKRMGHHCIIHQPSYSMLNRGIEDKLLDTLETVGMGCIVFCPLSQGLLTGKYLKVIPKTSRAAKSHGFLSKDQITPQLREKLKKLNDHAKGRGQSLAQMALAWALRDRRITSVLIGASSPAQIKENVKILKKLDFSQEELETLDSILVG